MYIPASINISLFFRNDYRYPLCRWNKPIYDGRTVSASLPCWHPTNALLDAVLFEIKSKKLVRFWKAREAKGKQKPQVYCVGFFLWWLWWWWWWWWWLWWFAFRSPLSSLLTVSTAPGLVFSSLFEYGWQNMALLHLYSLPLVQSSQPVKLLTSQRPQCHRVARSRDVLYRSPRDAMRQFIATSWCIHVTTERYLFTVLLTACLL